MPLALPQLELNRAAHAPATPGPCEVPYGGEYDGTWAASIIADMAAIKATYPSTDGQINVGRTGQAVQKVTLSGDVAMDYAGVTTIQPGVVTPPKMSTAAKVRSVQSPMLDLSGVAQTDVRILSFNRAATIVSILAVY